MTEEDLPLIEKEMKKIAKDGKRIVRHEISKEEALEKFKDDPYKLDLISRMNEEETVISCYSQGDFTDLCRGPHVDTVKEIKYFKLLKVSGAYWKGDANNKMLQRIYGVCFRTEEDLNDYLAELEDRKNRDHRKIGKDLDIFMSHDLVGKGMPLWLPNGSLVRKLLENYALEYNLDIESLVNKYDIKASEFTRKNPFPLYQDKNGTIIFSDYVLNSAKYIKGLIEKGLDTIWLDGLFLPLNYQLDVLKLYSNIDKLNEEEINNFITKYAIIPHGDEVLLKEDTII